MLKAGDIAGTVKGDGYRRIMIGGELMYEHRLVWLYHHEAWPENDLDHIDGCKTNNRIWNLREATRSENGFNQGLSKTNTSGFKGVSWNTSANKWKAGITTDGRNVHLGYFETKEDAAFVAEFVRRETRGVFHPGNSSNPEPIDKHQRLEDLKVLATDPSTPREDRWAFKKMLKTLRNEIHEDDTRAAV
jgi:hypothetical protein